MAEETPAASTAAAGAGEPVAERGPSTELKNAESKKETRPEELTGESTKEEKPAGKQSILSIALARQRRSSVRASARSLTRIFAPSSEGESAEKAEEPSAPAESTETKEEGGAEANGAPTSAKKAANGKRKSTGGTQKLSRKKSQIRVTHLDAKPGDYYLARLKSYPPWPAIICDEEMLPQTLLNTRPVTTKQADGTYKEPYADGGKRAHERTFPIMFLETNEL
jgi:hypothetical protein